MRITGERARYTWMDVGGRDLRIHARVFAVVEDGRRDVVLNDGEHDGFAWADPDALDLARHFRA